MALICTKCKRQVKQLTIEIKNTGILIPGEKLCENCLAERGYMTYDKIKEDNNNNLQKSREEANASQ